MLDMTSPSNRLRIVRAERWIKQWDLAVRTGINNSVLSAIENGRRKPTAAQAQALADALEMPIGELFPDHSEEAADVSTR